MFLGTRSLEFAMLASTKPSTNLTPSELASQVEAARRGVTLSAEEKSSLGQFLTPWPVAELIASLFHSSGGTKTISILDPGAGIGSLAASLVAHLLTNKKRPEGISVTACEADSRLISALEETMADCARICEGVGVKFTVRVIQGDFIDEATRWLQMAKNADFAGDFDCVILNPPYLKLRSDSHHRRILQAVGIETTNLYSAFVALSIALLKPQGQCLAITPRSFCNGPYFKSFRKYVLSRAFFSHIHLFRSRNSAFKEDRVVQENIIFRLEKASRVGSKQVGIALSDSPNGSLFSWSVPYGSVVYPDDSDCVIHIPENEFGQKAISSVRNLSCDLKDLGLTVSTGRVVDFRARDLLRNKPGNGTAPLIYPCHFHAGTILWPGECTKPSAIRSCDASKGLFVPQGTYVLSRRFSSKEEKRRVVAAVLEPAMAPGEVVGIENHLNYFHENGAGLPRLLARGLALFLNSSLFDTAFRQFSGHTQVNATDLRKMRYPTREQLNAMGRKFGRSLPTQEDIDAILEAVISE